MSRPYSTRVMRPVDWNGVRYFSPAEFSKPHMMGHEFVMWLDAVRHRAGVPMVVTSSYRTPEHNAEVGGASDSAHCDVPCNAVDIGARKRADDPSWNRSRFAIVSAAIALGCQRIGVYADGSLHLDMSHDTRPAPRMWTVVR